MRNVSLILRPFLSLVSGHLQYGQRDFVTSMTLMSTYCMYSRTLSSEKTIGNQLFVPNYSKLRSFWYILGMVLCNQAVEHNVATLSELSLLYTSREA